MAIDSVAMAYQPGPQRTAERMLIASISGALFAAGYSMNVASAYIMIPAIFTVATALWAAQFMLQDSNANEIVSKHMMFSKIGLAVGLISSLAAAGAGIGAFVVNYNHYADNRESLEAAGIVGKAIYLFNSDHYAFWCAAHLFVLNFFLYRFTVKAVDAAGYNSVDSRGLAQSERTWIRLDYMLAAAAPIQIVIGHMFLFSTDVELGAAWMCGLTSSIAGWYSIFELNSVRPMRSATGRHRVACVLHCIAAFSGLICMCAFQWCSYQFAIQTAVRSFNIEGSGRK